MKIIPAGKYESALVRLVDEVVMPNRNVTGHRYYMDLNRVVDRTLIHGIGTFLALAEETIVPWQLDWTDLDRYEEDEKIDIGVHRTPAHDRNDDERNAEYDELTALNEQICNDSILSSKSRHYIVNLDLTTYPVDIIEDYAKDYAGNSAQILSAYLRRLFNQIYTAQEVRAYVLISEPDIQILSEIANAIAAGKVTTNLPFPDLRNRLIDPATFAHGVLNFSPNDVRSVEHVRANREIQQYAKQIQTLLDQAPAGPDDPAITDALIQAYRHTETGRKAKTVLEIGTWIVKPLHYVPVVGEVLSVAEDLKDLAQKAAEKKFKQYEWFMIGVRMQQLAVEEYLSKLSNNRHPALSEIRDRDP